MLRDSLFYALARGIPAVINFGALALYTRLLTSGEYGDYVYVLALTGLLSASLFWWLRLSVTRILPSYNEPAEHTVFMGVLVRYYALLLGWLGLAMLGGLFFVDAGLRYLMLTGYLLLVAIVIYELLLEILRSNLKPKMFGVVSIVKAVTMTSVGGLLAYYGWGTQGLIVGGIIGHMVANCVALRAIPRQYFNYTKNKEIQEKLFSYGIPLAISFGFTIVLGQSDRVIIKWLLGAEAVGVYSAPYDLTWQSLGILGNIIGLATFPKIIAAYEKQGMQAAQEKLSQCIVLLCAVLLSASAGFYLVLPSFVPLMLGEEFRLQAMTLMPWIIGGAFLASLKAYYFDYAFHLAEKTLYQTFIVVVAAISNVALNFLLIPRYGVLGAAIATVIAYIVALAISIKIGKGVFRLPVPGKPLLQIVFATLVMTAGVHIVGLWLEAGLMLLMLQAMIGALLFGVSLYVMDTMSLKSKVNQKLRAVAARRRT